MVFLSSGIIIVRNRINILSAWRAKLNQIKREHRVALMVLSVIFIPSLFITWNLSSDEADRYITHHKYQFQFVVSKSAYNGSEYRHHTQLESHRFQMMLSKSPALLKLHQIMSKQNSLLSQNFYRGKEEIPYKKILYWPPGYPVNKVFPEPFGLGVGRDVYQRAGCPVWQCESSLDRSNLSQYDALLFNYVVFKGWDLPKTRYPHQRYVFFEIEPQIINRSSRGFFAPDVMKDFFNWTMTFRWDSDIVHPYGWIEPNGTVPLHPNEEEYGRLVAEPPKVDYAAGKTKMAAWMVTNCKAQSGRNDLVKHLMEHGIEVDVYGACGNMTCGIFNYHNDGKPKTDDTDEFCREMISSKYKFYFALENSLCIDYVTEKFYAMMRYPIVLVVMDAHGNHAKAAPPHSYINALDFPSTRALADYLIKLDGNDQLYNEYFWWKKHFTVKNSLLLNYFYKNYCNLCAALHDPSRLNIKKSYVDMIEWWIGESECKSAGFDGISTRL